MSLPHLDEFKRSYESFTRDELHELIGNAYIQNRDDLLVYHYENGGEILESWFSLAVENGSLKVMQLLVDYGICPREINVCTEVCWHLVVNRPVDVYIPVVCLLIKYNVFAKDGYDVFLGHAMTNCLPIVKLLLHPSEYGVYVPDLRYAVRFLLRNKNYIPPEIRSYLTAYLEGN